MKKKKLTKPKLSSRTEKFYDHFECQDYLKSKYPELDIDSLWDYIFSKGEIADGEVVHLYDFEKEDMSPEVQLAFRTLQKEFGNKTSVPLLIHW